MGIHYRQCRVSALLSASRENERSDVREMYSGGGILAFLTWYGKHSDPHFNISISSGPDCCRLYHPSFIPVRIRNAQFFGEHVPAVVAAAFTEKTPGRLRPGERAQGGCFLGRKKDYSNASPQLPRVAAREYSVARFSKKFVCSTPLSISSIHGSGLLSIWWIGLRPSCPSRRSAM